MDVKRYLPLVNYVTEAHMKLCVQQFALWTVIKTKIEKAKNNTVGRSWCCSCFLETRNHTRDPHCELELSIALCANVSRQLGIVFFLLFFLNRGKAFGQSESIQYDRNVPHSTKHHNTINIDKQKDDSDYVNLMFRLRRG